MTDTPLPADQLVRKCPEKQAAVSWPLPVDARLDELLAQAETAGENTSRKELAAAIIALTRLTDAQLGRLLRRYRKAKVRDLVSMPEGENVVPFMTHKPGPRTSSSPYPRLSEPVRLAVHQCVRARTAARLRPRRVRVTGGLVPSSSRSPP